MSEQRVVVPEGMLEAAYNVYLSRAETDKGDFRDCLEAALRWRVDNPVVPDDKWIDLLLSGKSHVSRGLVRLVCSEFQKRMFAPKDDPDEAIKDLLVSEQEPMSDRCFFRPDQYNERLREAYRRGQQSVKK